MVLDVSKFFQRGDTTGRAHDGIELEIDASGFVALEGPSGKGGDSIDLRAGPAAQHGATVVVAT